MTDQNWRTSVENNARPGDVTNLILDRDRYRAQRDRLLKACQYLCASGILRRLPLEESNEILAAISDAKGQTLEQAQIGKIPVALPHWGDL